jgi:hypothetical protein
MITKYMLVSALAGALVLFFWGFATHSGIPGYVQEFKDPKAVNDFIRAQAPENGVYMTAEGVLASVILSPDPADSSKWLDRTANIGPLLIREFLGCLLTAALLAGALAWARTATVLGGAMLLAWLAAASWVASGLSYWNWYGFSPLFVAVDAIDLVGGWFFTGLVIGAVKKKFAA